MGADQSHKVLNLPDTILARGVEVIDLEANALHQLAGALGQEFTAACEAVIRTQGRVVVTGMGKSGHIGRKLAATFAATGTPSNFVHPAEAAHGDLGMLVPGDLLIVISNSGNTAELRAFLDYSRTLKVPVIGIASRQASHVISRADIGICLPVVREACPANIAPTTSTILQLALCDALAMAVMDMRGFGQDGMRLLHPGGSIGLRLSPVSDIMHGAAQLPLVSPETHMSEVVSVMTSKGFGVAGVVDDDGNLIGVITDGDLRRHFNGLQNYRASDVMSGNPRTIAANVLAERAIQFLNDERITCAFIVSDAYEDSQKPIGIAHIHDFLRLGLSE